MCYSCSRSAYCTYVEIDEEWVYFREDEITKFESYIDVIKEMIDNTDFPVLVTYQRTSEAALCNDQDAYELIEEYYKHTLSHSEIHETLRGLEMPTNKSKF